MPSWFLIKDRLWNVTMFLVIALEKDICKSENLLVLMTSSLLFFKATRLKSNLQLITLSLFWVMDPLPLINTTFLRSVKYQETSKKWLDI
jgi:hypothetical protein